MSLFETMEDIVKACPEYTLLSPLFNRKCGRDVMWYIFSFLLKKEGPIDSLHPTIYSMTWNGHKYGFHNDDYPDDCTGATFYIDGVKHGHSAYFTGMSDELTIYNMGLKCWKMSSYEEENIIIYLTDEFKNILTDYVDCKKLHDYDRYTKRECYVDGKQYIRPERICCIEYYRDQLHCKCTSCECKRCTLIDNLLFDGYNWLYDGRPIHAEVPNYTNSKITLRNNYNIYLIDKSTNEK